MKKFKIIFIIFLSVVVILLLGLFIFLKTFDINRFKGQITQQISKFINREVSIKSISFEPSIKQGVTIYISELVINDHPSFSLDPMFTVDSAYFNIDALSLILKRQIFVSRIRKVHHLFLSQPLLLPFLIIFLSKRLSLDLFRSPTLCFQLSLRQRLPICLFLISKNAMLLIFSLLYNSHYLDFSISYSIS